ncbi:MAG: hypothetical protein K2Y29_13870 [Beijerinckiaceae bacterium]|nr:hypothetical protein [Beijerinckiaceae bacterium]
MQTNVDEGDEHCQDEGFALALAADEARRQAWACASLCAFMLVAMLASVLSGTA